MPNQLKQALLTKLHSRYGPLQKMEKSQSLYEIGGGACRVYIRYSKVHDKNSTFYGLRQEDLRLLEGHPAVICFLWDGQSEPLLVPFYNYEDVFRSLSPAGDGQYKVQVYINSDATELYIAGAGRFNVEAHVGWQELDRLLDRSRLTATPELSHFQVQTLLGSIGTRKGYDIWVPSNDRNRLDWSLADTFDCCAALPLDLEIVKDVLMEIDVIWVVRGAGRLHAMFEVEHSTPIYSGLLRFNDIFLVSPRLGARFTVVSNDERRSLFTRQLNRPTFKLSKLDACCTFLDYASVYSWHQGLETEARAHADKSCLLDSAT